MTDRVIKPLCGMVFEGVHSSSVWVVEGGGGAGSRVCRPCTRSCTREGICLFLLASIMKNVPQVCLLWVSPAQNSSVRKGEEDCTARRDREARLRKDSENNRGARPAFAITAAPEGGDRFMFFSHAAAGAHLEHCLSIVGTLHEILHHDPGENFVWQLRNSAPNNSRLVSRYIAEYEREEEDHLWVDEEMRSTTISALGPSSLGGAHRGERAMASGGQHHSSSTVFYCSSDNRSRRPHPETRPPPPPRKS